MRRLALVSCCCLALLIAGCPKRQTSTRIVYVPSPPPPADSSSTESQETMVIQEPEPPPAPVEIVPEKTPAPEVKTKPRQVPRNEPPPPAPEEAQPTAPPSAEIPALEPRETSAQEAALRRNVQSLQEDIRQRLSRINEVNLSAADRRTLNDARNFFSQSGKAFDEGDLQRAQNLAQKASLLVRALEQLH